MALARHVGPLGIGAQIAMELKEFIKSSLLEIMGGVHEAQTQWNEGESNRGIINPAWGKPNERHVSIVSFDVAVTAGSSNDGTVKGGIKVWGLDFGGKATEMRSDSTVSHIKFDVPIIPSTIEVREDVRTMNFTGVRKGIA